MWLVRCRERKGRNLGGNDVRITAVVVDTAS
jgi:hypothetical protein